MKLRQKLAAVMAAAMVVTSVPVVTMAASTSYVSKVAVTHTDSATNGFDTNLVIDIKDTTEATTNQVVYLEMTGAQFDSKAYPQTIKTQSGDATVSYESTTTLKVELPAKVLEEKISIPVKGVKVTADEVKVAIDGDGTKAIDNETVVVARRSDSKAKVTGATANKIDGEGEIAKITIEEPFKNVLTGETVAITLDNTNYKFTSEPTITFGKGLSGVTAENVEVDKDEIRFTVPAGLNKESLGTVTITGVEVKCTDKTADIEDITVTVTSNNDKVAETTLTVASVVEEGGTLTLSDEAVEFNAGQEKTVKVKLKETLANSFVVGRDVEFTIDNGALKAAPADTTPIYEDDDNTKAIIGFVYTVDADDKTNGKLNKEFTLELAPSIDDSGVVTLTASGKRAIGEDLTLEIATINAPFTVKMNTIAATAGVKDQKGGKLTITETEKGNIKAGTFQIQLEDGVKFSDAPEIKVTAGDMVIEKVEVDSTTKSILNVTVKRASKTASTIEISNFAVSADRTMADGSYTATISGTNLGKGEIEIDKFLVVGEQDVTASFKIGAATYTVNGEEKAMDGQAYLTENGRTMIPVRYVSEAFGISGKDVLFNKGTVTLLAGNRTIQLTNGSNIAILNGVQITMDEKVVIKDGRTYIPMGEIGRLLGVSVSWDNTTKTATFTK